MNHVVKNILVVSASIGSGHNQAARAVMGELKNQYPKAEINMVDFMAGENSYITTLIKETYLKMLAISPNIYDLLYRWTKVSRQGSKVQNVMALIMKRSMSKLIERYKPELIICTHPFPGGAVAHLKKAGKINIPLAVVITDFAVHHLWVHRHVDLYFVAQQEVRSELIAYGVKAARVYVTGIPIGAQFSKKIDGKRIARELKLQPQVPTVLIMGGGLGLGGVKQALLSLQDVLLPLQLLVVTGDNDSLRESLREVALMSQHRVEVIGYTERIAELMAAADVLITKPGALTISEALAMQLPMLLYESIPGQEKENAAYLVAQGVADWVKNSKQLSTAINDFFRQPDKISEVKSKEVSIAHPKAAMAVAQLVGQYIAAKQSIASGE